MSWDVMLFKFEGEPPDFNDLPEDYEPPVMGDAQEIRDKISSVLPDVDWSRPDWGVLINDAFSIEFNLQESGDVNVFTLHIRGGGDPLSVIVELCKAHNWSAFDSGTGEYVDLENPSSEGFLGFQGYRDQVIGQDSHQIQTRTSYKRYAVEGFGIILILLALFLLLRKIKYQMTR
jgi:hypothetical protein